MNIRTLVLGDVHGGLRSLLQCLERSQFDYNKDRLIVLGDVADGWTEVAECFEELFRVKNLVYIRGNHDSWLKDWLKEGKKPLVWTMQGGENTMKSYFKLDHDKWKVHASFLKKAPFFFVDEKNRLYVHGGIKPDTLAEDNDKMYAQWDRDLWNLRPQTCKYYNEVFVGHTSIYNAGGGLPQNHGNVWFLDTGGGWEGKLTIMDPDTKQFWQSDVVSSLYPEDRGRT
jgi:serine/threonine protein phosphatase 1